MTAVPDVAYYYPAPYWGWRESGWIKSLLLFFDEISILLPNYMYGRHSAEDPTLVLPLEERASLGFSSQPTGSTTTWRPNSRTS